MEQAHPRVTAAQFHHTCTNNLIPLVILFPPCSSAAPTACPAGWTSVANKCFKYDAGKRNYKDSVNYCKTQGGTIASIHSNQENAVVMTLAKTVAFIGAESDGKGNWKWNDGSSWWQPATEKHDGIKGTGETRIAMNTDNRWHDWGTGSDALGVICAMTAGTATGMH